MSFDLKIESNDLTMNAEGGLATVQDNQKIAQEVTKGVLTPLGSNRFFRWYGSTVSINTVGTTSGAGFIETEAQRSIQEMLSNIISLQKAQSRTQYVSPGEMIASIKEISVIRYPEDPRLYQVVIKIITRQLTEVVEIFSLSV